MTTAVREVIAGTFGLTLDQVPDDAEAGTFDRWDSLAQLELMLALESRFGIRIAAAEMLRLLSVPKIVAYLEAQGLVA